MIDCQLSNPPTVLQALYYMSALSVATGHLVETDSQGNPVQIELADSKHPVAAPSASGSQLTSTSVSAATSATVIYPPASGQEFKLIEQSQGHSLLLEPWKSPNNLGGKCFRGTLFPNRDPKTLATSPPPSVIMSELVDRLCE